jgi:hypothetical protein
VWYMAVGDGGGEEVELGVVEGGGRVVVVVPVERHLAVRARVGRRAVHAVVAAQVALRARDTRNQTARSVSVL